MPNNNEEVNAFVTNLMAQGRRGLEDLSTTEKIGGVASGLGRGFLLAAGRPDPGSRLEQIQRQKLFQQRTGLAAASLQAQQTQLQFNRNLAIATLAKDLGNADPKLAAKVLGNFAKSQDIKIDDPGGLVSFFKENAEKIDPLFELMTRNLDPNNPQHKQVGELIRQAVENKTTRPKILESLLQQYGLLPGARGKLSQPIVDVLASAGITPESATPGQIASARQLLRAEKREDVVPQVGQIPPGFELQRSAGGFRLEEIPGSPAVQERQEKTRSRATISAFAVRDARKAREFLKQRPNVAARLAEQYIPGTPSYSLVNRLESLRSTVAIDQLLNIKRQGSGLGQVPQAQLDLLSRLMGELSLGLPTKELDQLIQDIQKTYSEVLKNMTPKDIAQIGVAQREQGGKLGASGEADFVYDPTTKKLKRVK